MHLIIAGVRKEYPEGSTVSDLLRGENVEMPQYVSVSVNDAFVRSGDYGAYRLKDGDAVEFLYFMGGGAGGTDE